MRTKPFALILVAASLSATAINAKSAEEEILAELRALRVQIEALEARVAELENQPAPLAPENAEREGNQRKWFDYMNVELKKAEIRASGPWTKASTWKLIKKGMDAADVIAALGEPTDRKFSVRKDTDEIFYYRGDLDGSGEQVEGEVRIYKDKVRRFVVPDFPE
ncbi:hypothetical protein [Pelagicoccus sp. SDUM812003]|uniref:hypothetical protein n=1 Tax=Pelagicoccus sp. SDUM812003 TaxID=3041267 RepID=UPI00280EACCE|nr:hypothetical protein [Pelagicoccus sp. SDUM812003]MDQ8202678.1 hypothetical protein [Pelagicoccus sp. SDUM812003]